MNIILEYLPPSLNSLYRARNSRIYKSKAYVDFEKKVSEELAKIENVCMFENDIKLNIIFEIKHKKRSCDIDNYLKCLIDALQHAKIISNDRNVTEITCKKILNCSGNKTLITIS